MPIFRDDDEERLARLELLLDQLRQREDVRAERVEQQLNRLHEKRMQLRARYGREQLQRRAG